MRVTFPQDFLWGAATAAYQIEGSAREDGRGKSIWDVFSHSRWRTANGDTGDVACDHYRRWKEDVLIMKELGLKAYRFSVAWPRILPKGTGIVNQKGIDFYRRLVDALLEAGIRPFATLYHWDLPQVLEDKGGWPNRDVADWFADYASVMFKALGDGVEGWFTLNEPICTAFIGYHEGCFAPGRNCLTAALQAAHNQLLAHGRAVEAFRASDACGKIGIVVNLADVSPATRSEADRAAAERLDAWSNRWYVDPVFGKGYPRVLVDWYGREMPVIPEGDMKTVAAPIDFFGLNYYSGMCACANPQGGFLKASSTPLEEPGTRRTDMDWGVWPEGLYRLLMRLKKDYGDPVLYVTENGMANPGDEPDENGRVEDDERVDYLERHFTAAARAIEDGAKLQGYFVWSLLDNFEWAHGYTKRFGLVHVDYRTQQRTMKKSARWYAEVIADGGFGKEEPLSRSRGTDEPLGT